MDALPKAFYKSSLLLNGLCHIQECSSISSDDLCLLFCLFLLLYSTMGWREEKGEGGMSFSRVDWQGVGEGGGSDAG